MKPITLPHRSSRYVEADGRPTGPVYDLFLALVARGNAITPQDVTDVLARLAALEATADPWANVYGTEGIAILGSLESGLEIRGPGAAASTGSAVPYLIPAEVSYAVPENAQALFHLPIQINGSLVVDGALVEV